MAVCALDYRYGRDVMKKIFSEEGKLERMLRVEGALAVACARAGIIPEKDARIIDEKASLESVSLDHIKEIEAEIKHDVMAMVKALASVCGDSGKYVHLGATSNDIIDTATALQLRDAILIIRNDLETLLRTLCEMAVRYKETIMLGRTHGQAALPITFGLKQAVYALEFLRHLERLDSGMSRFCVGKMSGAVGTGAAFGKSAMKVQQFVMEELGISYEAAATQVVGRDRYVEIVCLLGNIATSAEKVATEIRNLQRTEIGEVMEHFDVKKQVGSSTMAHKRNPIISENICGLCRVIRSFIAPMMESAVLWHERDLANSSAERLILPHTFVLLDDVLVKLNAVLKGLRVNKQRMLENLKRAGDVIMAEAVVIKLVEKGLGRQEAHELVRQCALNAMMANKSLMEAVLEREEVATIISEEELRETLRPDRYLGMAYDIVDNVVKSVEDYLMMSPTTSDSMRTSPSNLSR